MNKNEFISAMKRYGDRQSDLADAIGLSRVRLSAKINERNGASFSQPEISTIKRRYKLSDSEIVDIFFN